MRRDRGEMLRARSRVLSENPEPVELLVGLLGTSAAVAVRWGVRGRSGIYLDLALRAGVWYCSEAAIVRFKEACGERVAG